MIRERITLARGQPVTISSAMSEPADSPRTAACPICHKPAVEKFRPFCSKRCADVDLNRWFTGAYVVAGREDEDEDGARNDGEGS
jgi:endogenous inhibitor of DNA gyrase (YacG/DUF329 family)